MRLYFISRIDGRTKNAFPGKRFTTKQEATLYLRGRSYWDDVRYKIIETEIPPFGNTKKTLIDIVFKDDVDVAEQSSLLKI